MCLAIFSFHLSKVLRPPRNRNARSYEVLHLSHKIIFPKLKTWCSKMQPLSRNQRPDLLTSLMNMSLVLRLPPKCPTPAIVFLEMLQNPHVLLTFGRVHNSLRLLRETTSERPKVLRTRQFFALLTSKCASRHNGVQWFIPHLATCPTRRFSEPTFRPSGATNHWKKTVKPRLFYLFLHLHLLSPDSFSSLIFSLLLFSSFLFSYLTLPTSAFPSVHIVGSLTSKLSSTMICHDVSLFPILSC